MTDEKSDVFGRKRYMERTSHIFQMPLLFLSVSLIALDTQSRQKFNIRYGKIIIILRIALHSTIHISLCQFIFVLIRPKNFKTLLHIGFKLLFRNITLTGVYYKAHKEKITMSALDLGHSAFPPLIKGIVLDLFLLPIANIPFCRAFITLDNNSLIPFRIKLRSSGSVNLAWAVRAVHIYPVFRVNCIAVHKFKAHLAANLKGGDGVSVFAVNAANHTKALPNALILKQITDADMKKAAAIAQATEFIDAKPEGYDSPIAQGGSNVSGGQKQRLSIARAIAKAPRIYLFDDSFSALDYKTDVTLRRALKAETGDATVIIVAQRISTVLHANQILVLDEGRLVGRGTHAQLMASCPEYQEIARSQLSQKELDLKDLNTGKEEK